MKYSLLFNLSAVRRREAGRILVAIGLLLSLFVVGFAPTIKASAPYVSYTPVPFTQTEIDDNWIVDRSVPSGGYSSVNFGGRDNVLEMKIDAENRSNLGSFYNTEGLQRALPSVLSIKADVYIPSSWGGQDIRAGMWGVGHDSANAVSAYPIVEFTSGDYTGWRSWDGVNGGWTNLADVAYNTDGWNTVELTFNESTHMFDVSVNGVYVVTSDAGDSEDLGAIILNSYNFGPDSGDYDTHWSNFAYGIAAPYPVSGFIITPKDGLFVDGQFQTKARFIDGDEVNDDPVQWAVRKGSCSSNTIAGNVDGFDSDYKWDGNFFNSRRDTASWSPGMYCFVFNPSEDAGETDVRETGIFYVPPRVRNDCREGKWANFGRFNSQQQCVNYVDAH